MPLLSTEKLANICWLTLIRISRHGSLWLLKNFQIFDILRLLNTVDHIWSRCCISVSTNILLTILPGTRTIPQVYNNRISTTLNKLAMFIWNFWAFLLPFSSNHCKYFEKKKYKLPPTQLTQGQTGFLHVSFWFLLKKNLKD